MKIDSKRLFSTIHTIGKIGEKSNLGISRIAFSNEYFKALEELKNLMEMRNLNVRIDNVGNIFGRRNGIDNKLPVILIGSHLDTVNNGGLYDGNLGIMAAIECISILNDNNILTNHPIDVVGFNAEEGSELGGTFGSRTALGLQSLDIPNIDEKLSKYSLNRNDIASSQIDYNIHGFLELHIEQGIRLYNDKISIGIVSGIVGITRYKITVSGSANHAGTTPMSMRHDALVSASKLITYIFNMANDFGDPFVATVGKLDVFPNSVNVIPGKVEFILEIRDIYKNKIDDFIKEIEKVALKIPDFDINIELYNEKESILLNEKLISIIQSACKSKQYSYNIMVSGAGHDSMELAKKVPTGMIFIPSKDGISHSKDEYSTEEDIIKGTEVLLETILLFDENKIF